jgi:hypothetical protein
MQVSAAHNYRLDFEVHSKDRISRAQRIEARLLKRYKKWLEAQDRELHSVKYGGLQCDGYEKLRRNLIEAKSSESREHVRMAVGQLLDYAFQGRKKLGDPHMAVLLPAKPSSDIEEWLESLAIKLVWPVSDVFLDNANGQFT